MAYLGQKNQIKQRQLGSLIKQQPTSQQQSLLVKPKKELKLTDEQKWEKQHQKYDVYSNELKKQTIKQIGIVGNDQEEELKTQLADIIRKKGWSAGKTYEAAMYDLFRYKPHPYGTAHWEAAKRMVFGTRQKKRNLKKNNKTEEQVENERNRREEVKYKAKILDALIKTLKEYPEKENQIDNQQDKTAESSAQQSKEKNKEIQLINDEKIKEIVGERNVRYVLELIHEITVNYNKDKKEKQEERNAKRNNKLNQKDNEDDYGFENDDLDQ